jgi:hypothetical protein
MSKSVLFLDLARQTGWAEGGVSPDARAMSGTVRLAPDGSDSPAVFAGMIDFLGNRLLAFKPKTIVYEAPFDPRHMKKINENTIRLAWGLPAIVEAIAYKMGVYDIRMANVNDVRRSILGSLPQKNQAKLEVKRFVRALGYDPKDDNEADAILGWLYACTILDSKVGVRISPLFSGLK